MVERRRLMRGGLMAGMGVLAASPAAGAAGDDASRAIDERRAVVERRFDEVYTARWRGVARVRQQQRIWLRSAFKYPDFLEVGLDVWEDVYDWHVVYQQPVTVQRLGDGRYSMTFMFTTLLLRPDQAHDFVGQPFDAR